jgi:ADP-L-glycero-D-manno-heptose 6-epimerase
MIVVTGANGFIAANLLAELQRRGAADLLAVDEFPSIRGNLASSAPPDNARFHFPAVSLYLDKGDLAPWLDANIQSVTAIFHLGACSDTTEPNRAYLIKNNFQYTRTLWNWCTQNARPFIYASSAATYGDGALGYDDQADPTQYQPLNFYGESKHLFDLWALSQTQTPPRWVGLKYFNVYGPHEEHKNRMASVAYHAFHQIRQTASVSLFQSHKPGFPHGGQKRDFVFVNDAVDATLFFLDTPPSSQAPNGLYNIGTGEARTFEDLARAVFTAMNLAPNIQYIPMPEDLREKYQYFTQATVAKLRHAGFTRPFCSIEQGVAHYVKYLLAANTGG